jgi:hypothetical protein
MDESAIILSRAQNDHRNISLLDFNFSIGSINLRIIF